MKELQLTKGYVAIVDDEDYERVGGRVWKALVNKESRTVYAVHWESAMGRTVAVLLHRFLMGAPIGVEVDHRDGNGLNCRRYNLRLATDAQNKHNRGIGSANTSGYKGVSRRSDCDKWRAQIMVNRKYIHLGNFDTPQAAAEAYAVAALKYHGEFAKVK